MLRYIRYELSMNENNIYYDVRSRIRLGLIHLFILYTSSAVESMWDHHLRS